MPRATFLFLFIFNMHEGTKEIIAKFIPTNLAESLLKKYAKKGQALLINNVLKVHYGGLVDTISASTRRVFYWLSFRYFINVLIVLLIPSKGMLYETSSQLF